MELAWNEAILKDHRAVCRFDVGKRVIVKKRQFDPGIGGSEVLVHDPSSGDTWWLTEEAVSTCPEGSVR